MLDVFPIVLGQRPTRRHIQSLSLRVNVQWREDFLRCELINIHLYTVLVTYSGHHRPESVLSGRCDVSLPALPNATRALYIIYMVWLCWMHIATRAEQLVSRALPAGLEIRHPGAASGRHEDQQAALPPPGYA